MATVCCQGKTFRSISAVLFDKDGTLANVEDYLKKLGLARSHFIARSAVDQSSAAQLSAEETQALSSTLESAILSAFGLSHGRLNPAGLLAVGSRHDNEVAAATCLTARGWGWIKALKTVQSAFVQAADTLPAKVINTPLLPDVHQALERMKAVGINIGVVSSDLHSEVTAFVEHYKLEQITWHRGFSPDALSKTHPEFLNFACNAMSIQASKTLIIGDSDADYELSKQGAAGFLGMTGGWSEQPIMDSKITTFYKLRQLEVFSDISPSVKDNHP